MHVLIIRTGPDIKSPRRHDCELVLPQLGSLTVAAQPRRILGQVLQGERGELYERFGSRVRRLRGLVSGPGGELLETPQETCEPPRQLESPGAHSPRPAVEANEPKAPTVEQSSIPATAFVHKLLPEPGVSRVVPFQAFKPMLSHQISQPTRLRDSHRLACHVQVFEAAAPVQIQEFVRAIVGPQALPTDLQPLSSALSHQLEINSLIPEAKVPPFTPEQQAVRPGQRFFRLTLAADPTAQSAGSRPSRSEEMQGASAVEKSIPAQLLRPWEFTRSRDEALQAAQKARSLWSRLVRPLRRMLFRGEVQRWQLLLSGRSSDDQLWTVPPPRGWLADPWLQRWAATALAAGGYQPEKMLTEWELFWRRKNVF